MSLHEGSSWFDCGVPKSKEAAQDVLDALDGKQERGKVFELATKLRECIKSAGRKS